MKHELLWVLVFMLNIKQVLYDSVSEKLEQKCIIGNIYPYYKYELLLQRRKLKRWLRIIRLINY